MNPRQCSKCSRSEPDVAFYTTCESSLCKTCHCAYLRDRKAAIKAGTWIPTRGQGKREPKPEAAPIEPQLCEHDKSMLDYGETVVRQCGRSAYNAVDVITSGWSALQ